MKKWQKTTIISASLLTPIIPTAALLTSCSSTSTTQSLNADWTTSFDNVKQFTGITTKDELIEKLSNINNNSKNSQQFLKRICTALKISVPDNNEIRLQDNKVVESNNSLFFTILVGLNLDDDNLLRIKKYSSAITNLDINIGNSTILENSLVDSNKYTSNNFNSIYGMNLVTSKEDSLPSSQSGIKYSSDSKEVQEYLNNISYSLLPDSSNESSLKKDLDYFVKESFFDNFRDWNIPSYELSNYNNFANVKISPIQKSKSDNSLIENTEDNLENQEAKVELCMQIQNNSSVNRVFRFLKQEFNLNPKQVLTIEVIINNISRANLLEVNNDGDIGLSFNNVILNSQISGSQINKVENLNLTINKSFSVNQKLLNVTGNNNPFNEKTIENFNKLFDSYSDELSIEKLQARIVKEIEKSFAIKKQEALINAKIIEVFAIPAVYSSDISKYDNDKDGQFTLYDLLTNLGGPISDWYKLKGFNEAADIISNILSPKPIYKAFHDTFDSIIALLRSIDSAIVSDILDFIEQSLTINGKVKSEQQFREFFINISNLKEVVAPILINTGSMSAYQIEYILSLIDTLSNPDQHILIWLSNNFSSILNLVGMFVQLPSAIENIITGLGTINITYNGKQNCNILTDIPLYNLLSREGLSIKKYIGLINAALLLGDGLFSTIFNAIGLKETDIISSLGMTLIKQIIRIVGGQSSRRQIKAANWGEAFKSYWIPKEYNGVDNTKENKTIYDIISEDEDSYKFSYEWTPLETNSKSLPKYTLNHKLSLDLKLPNYKFEFISASGPAWALKRNEATVSNIKYDYYFPNSSITPVIRKENNQTFVDISIPTYTKTNGVSIAMALPTESFVLSDITSELTQDRENIFSSYSTSVYYDKTVLLLSKDNTTLLNLSSDLLKNSDYEPYRLLTESGYVKLINALNEYSINLNLNDITIRPSVYIEHVPATKNKPEEYKVHMKFPVNILVREYDSTNDKEVDSLKNLITFNVEVNQ